MTLVRLPALVPAERFPAVPLLALDTLWIQVAGTICNLECTHCFISCSPRNHAHEMMRLEEVRRYLDEARELGVRAYYFTGGEPFLNPDLMPMLEAAIAQGPVTVLTNGLLIKDAIARRLAELARGCEYSLDLRISIDGWDAATNDPIRGEGTFERILEGVRHLSGAGLNPVITVTEACRDVGTSEGRLRFLARLRSFGLDKPRLKVLPLLRIGAEVDRSRGYHPWETLESVELARDELERLQCSSGRAVSSRGVYVCPILIDSPAARMGSTLGETLRPFGLAHQACFTCHAEGLSCLT